MKVVFEVQGGNCNFLCPYLKVESKSRELKLGLCNNLERWDGVGSGREVQWGNICTPMADSC